MTAGNEAYVYRMVFYRCDMSGADLQGQVFDCETAPVQVKSCKTTVASWSMGGEVTMNIHNVTSNKLHSLSLIKKKIKQKKNIQDLNADPVL